MKDIFLEYLDQCIKRFNVTFADTFQDYILEEEITREDGSKSIITKLPLEININMADENKIDIINTPILIHYNMFSKIDMYVENKYPHIQGKNYYDKYKAIEGNNPINLILKGCYRICKLIRNAMIHNINAINLDDRINVISYPYNRTQYYLKISNDRLIDLYKCIEILLDDRLIRNRGNNFIQGVCGFYYNQIVNDIVIKDEINKSQHNNMFPNLSVNLMTLAPNRSILRDARYSTDGGVLTIHSKDSSIIKDYQVVYNDKTFLIPQEALSENRISVSRLVDWQYAN